jgi:hypothetical protein
MDPLTSLGLACNVTQILSFVSEIIKLSHKVRVEGTLDKDLEDASQRLQNSYRQLEKIITDRAAQVNVPLSQPHAELVELARTCLDSTSALITQLEKIQNAHGGPLGKAILAVLRKPRTDELERSVRRYSEVLHTKLLSQIWSVVFSLDIFIEMAYML